MKQTVTGRSRRDYRIRTDYIGLHDNTNANAGSRAVIIGKKSSINNSSLFSIWKCTETHLAAWGLNPAAALIITWLFHKAETQKTILVYQVVRI